MGQAAAPREGHGAGRQRQRTRRRKKRRERVLFRAGAKHELGCNDCDVWQLNRVCCLFVFIYDKRATFPAMTADIAKASYQERVMNIKLNTRQGSNAAHTQCAFIHAGGHVLAGLLFAPLAKHIPGEDMQQFSHNIQNCGNAGCIACVHSACQLFGSFVPSARGWHVARPPWPTQPPTSTLTQVSFLTLQILARKAGQESGASCTGSRSGVNRARAACGGLR